MSYLVLARKWRPTKFEEVIGQESVVRTLKNAIKLDRVAHAYLLTGARGVGKTTIARLFAKAINCEQGPTADPDNSCTSCIEISQGISPDVFEIDGASNTGVDDVRTLRENSHYLPARNRYKIYIIDEVHMLSVSAFNALLKTLEEPPAHVKFVFATTEPHKIPTTVISRCQRFDLKRIPTPTIFEHLSKILAKEKAEIEEEGLRTIAREAAGSLRDALSLTDQVLAFGGEAISNDQVIEALGLTKSSLYERVVTHLIESQPDPLMRLIEQLFDEGHDLKRFLEGLLWYFRHLILYRSIKDPKNLVDTLPEEHEQLQNLAQKADVLRWHQMFDVCSKALYELGINPYPRIVVEIALLRLSAVEPLLEIGTLIERLDNLINTTQPVDEAPAVKDTTQRKRVDKHITDTQKKSRLEDNRAESIESSQQHGSWQGLVELVAKNRPSLGSVLYHARPLEVTPKLLKIALEPESFFSDQMKVDRNIKDLKRYCQEYFGQQTKIQVEEICLTEGLGASLAESHEQKQRETQKAVREEVAAHPMVKEAIRIFNAELEQVRPFERKQT